MADKGDKGESDMVDASDAHRIRFPGASHRTLRMMSVLLFLSLLSIGLVQASEVSKQFSTEAWNVNYVLSSDTAQPGSQLTLTLEITATKNSYDFELWVSPTPPLTVSRQGGQDPHVSYSEFKGSEKHIEVFTIGVPSTVKEKETYGIGIRAQSFNGPALLGAIRNPLLPPDFSVDTSSDPAKMLFVSVFTAPVLSVGEISIPNSVTRGETLSVTIPFTNTGTGTAKVGRLLVTTSNGMQLLSTTGFVNGSDIMAGQRIVVTVSLQAIGEGMQNLDVTLSGSNAAPVKQSFQINVTKPLGETVTEILTSPTLLVLTAVILLILAFAYLARRRYQY